jgi:outer membrane protein
MSRSRHRLLTLLVSSALALAFLVLPGVAGAQTKIAVIDTQRAVASTEDGIRAQATLRKLFDARQQELNKKQGDLAKQREDIEKQSKTLSKGDWQTKMEDWQKRMLELQAIFVDYNKELEKKQKELTEPVFERIGQIVKRMATAENIDLVLEKATAAYVRSDLELTDKVIQLYNSGGGLAPKK